MVDFADIILKGTLALWQLAFIVAVTRRVWRLGLVAVAMASLWVFSYVWAGLGWEVALAALVFAESLLIASVMWFGSIRSRFSGVPLALLGLLASGALWWTGEFAGWKVGIVVSGTSATFLALLIVPIRSRVGRAHYLPREHTVRSSAYKYSYWSERALESVTLDVGSNSSRPHLQLKEIELPTFGGWAPKVSLSSVASRRGRHYAAMEIESWLDDFTYSDPVSLATARAGAFLRGSGSIFVTAYGSEKADSLEGSTRVAIFTVVQREEQTVGICLFGSMDNFDGYIRDAHPEAMTGWASSATLDVMKWLQKGEPWRRDRWGESIGNEACKMANHHLAGKSPATFASVTAHRNYEKDYVMRQDGAEWFAQIYHVESREGEDSLPYDYVLIGRPYWIRSRYQRIRTTGENSLQEMAETPLESAERIERDRWRNRLDLPRQEGSWPGAAFQFIRWCNALPLDVEPTR